MLRPIRFDYYGPKQGRGKDAKRPLIKTIRGSNYDEIVANVSRYMTRKNRFDAEICEVTDETYGELLLVASCEAGKNFHVMFEGDVTQPVYVTNFTKDELALIGK